VNKKIFLTISIYLVGFVLIAYILMAGYLRDVELKMHTKMAKSMQKSAQDAVDNKAKDTYVLALGLSLGEDAKTALLTHYTKHLNFKTLSKSLVNSLGFEHLWLQIITKDGLSLYRSWTDKKGDNLLGVRDDIRELLGYPKTLSSIGIGKYTLSFKTIQPVWYDNKLIGLVELISKFDSVVNDLNKNGYESLVLIDKAHNNKLQNTLHQKNIDGYRIATSKASTHLLSSLSHKNMASVLKNPFVTDKKNDLFLARHNIYNNKGNLLGYIVVAKHLSHIDMTELENTKQQLLYLMAIIVLIVIFGLLYLYNTKYKSFIQKQNTLLSEKVKERTESLNFMALHDSLTNLPNRELLMTSMEDMLSKAKKEEKSLYVVFLDLDNFKDINDAYGHAAGDTLLQTVSQRVESLMSSTTFFARVSGDEFVLVIEGWQKQEVERFLKKLLTEIQKPFYIDNTQMYVGASIGISFFPVYGQTVAMLMKESDTAMYLAKEKGKNRYQFYEFWMELDKKKRQELGKELRHALMHDEINVYFQPKVNVQEHTIVGFESLVRWEHPTQGMMYPDTFLTLAAELGLLEQFDYYVRKKSMEQMLQWKEEGLDVGVLSINIGPHEIGQKNFTLNLQKLCEEVNFDMHDLEVEIVENQIVDDTQRVIEVLNDIRALGVSIAIDDFGTGYSSFAYLHDLPVQTLKIDRSFISDLEINEKSVKIVRMITLLSHQLGLEVIAEGVETKEQLRILMHEGCQIIQGYYISKPLSFKDAKAFILQYNAKSS